MITHVAIKYNGIVYALPRPNRHHNVIRSIKGGINGLDAEGFLDEVGNFITRKEAYHLAVSTGQLDRSKHPPGSYNGTDLYSEDLW